MTAIPDGFTIRPGDASGDDADRIAAMCRAAFPGAPEWQASHSIARSWWRGVLAAGRCPLLVAEDTARRCAGFAVHNADPSWWAAAQRRGPHAKWMKLLTAARHPRLIRARLRKLRRSRAMAARDASGSAGPATATPLVGVRFLGLILVAEHARGSGVSDALLACVERSAAGIGQLDLRVHVDARNETGRRFYERNGYHLAGYRSGSAVLNKSLASPAP